MQEFAHTSHRHLMSILDLSGPELLKLSTPVSSQERQACLRPQRHTSLALEGQTANLVFQQPSLRTLCSFSSAAHSLGLRVSAVQMTPHELRDQGSFEDELRQASHLGVVTVVRASQSLANMPLEGMAGPLVNAGDGANEHPTQAVLDLSVLRHFDLGGKTLVMMGNLKGHRVNHSLLRGLALLASVSAEAPARVVLLSPPDMAMPRQYLPSSLSGQGKECGCLQVQELLTSSKAEVSELLSQADLIYQSPLASWETPTAALEGAYRLDMGRAKRVFRAHTKVLHPFPRLGELCESLDGTPHDGYHLQTASGPSIRKRLLRHVLRA